MGETQLWRETHLSVFLLRKVLAAAAGVEENGHISKGIKGTIRGAVKKAVMGAAGERFICNSAACR